jgi:hypothetical protein
MMILSGLAGCHVGSMRLETVRGVLSLARGMRRVLCCWDMEVWTGRKREGGYFFY